MLMTNGVRMILALGTAEDMARVQTMHPGKALTAAARAYGVERGALAVLWAEKLVSCARARAAVAEMQAAEGETFEA